MTKTKPAPDRPVAPVRRRTFNARFNEGLNKVLAQLKVEDVPHIKRIVTTVVGGTILIIGAAMVFLPGPGLLVMLGGLALLGTEYAWARRLMRRSKLMAHKALSRTQQIFTSKDKPATTTVVSATPARTVALKSPESSAAEPLDGEAVSLAH